MKYIQIPIEKPATYVMTGKFKSPFDEWKHLNRQLLDYELIVITEGILYLTLHETNHTLSKGDYLLCPPNSNQSGFKPSDCSFYWLHFETDGMNINYCQSDTAQSYINPLSKDLISIPFVGKTYSLEKLIIQMKNLQDSIRSYNNTIQNNYLTTSILCELNSQCHLNYFPKNNNSRNQQLYNDIMDYIKSNQNINLKVLDIANHFGYNEKYLSHLFQSVKGMSLKQYILKEKIEIAKYQLADTNKTIAVIATELGFNDSHNFMKSFKKQIGMTPSEYRNVYNKRMLYYK